MTERLGRFGKHGALVSVSAFRGTITARWTERGVGRPYRAKRTFPDTSYNRILALTVAEAFSDPLREPERSWDAIERDVKETARLQAIRDRVRLTHPDGEVLVKGSIAAPGWPVVYGLRDPEEPGRIRYVGRTDRPLVRYLQHLNHSRNPKLSEWVEGLKAEGRYPDMVLLAEPIRGLAVDILERRWIANLASQGQADLNRTSLRNWSQNSTFSGNEDLDRNPDIVRP